LAGNITQRLFGMREIFLAAPLGVRSMSASAPYVIAPVELILVLYKDNWKKQVEAEK